MIHSDHHKKPASQESKNNKAAETAQTNEKDIDIDIDLSDDDLEKTAASVAEALQEEPPKEDPVKKLQEELVQEKDRALRSLAELENFRQRKNRELADIRKYDGLDLAREILPVWDNMGRALEAAEKDLNVEPLIEGVRMIHQQFLDILEKNHIKMIKPVGEAFDPNFHQSIAMLPSDKPAGEILEETQAGFILHDRVVRPSQVVVSAPKPKEAAPPQEEKKEGEKAE